MLMLKKVRVDDFTDEIRKRRKTAQQIEYQLTSPHYCPRQQTRNKHTVPQDQQGPPEHNYRTHNQTNKWHKDMTGRHQGKTGSKHGKNWIG